ncbi:MAG: pentapeptide repeat-containing protein [Myxacorys chilensis ATA2-1-KO14]|nr:pentapeptide repeat-containing protein [Myxacorys chilensis ATA2-1-KO14]
MRDTNLQNANLNGVDLAGADLTNAEGDITLEAYFNKILKELRGWGGG